MQPEDETKGIISKARKLTSGESKKLFVAFEPISAVIIEELRKLKSRAEKAEMLREIIEDERAATLSRDARTKARTVCYEGNRGRKQKSWQATLAMAVTMNAAGRNVCFLPESSSQSSADALIQFQKQYRIADFKHSTTDNYNTIATELAHGFRQAQCVVLRMERGDLNTFIQAIEQLKRKGATIGDMVIINKYGKTMEIDKNRLRSDRYKKLLKGFF